MRLNDYATSKSAFLPKQSSSRAESAVLTFGCLVLAGVIALDALVGFHIL